MYMKKFFALALSLVMALSLVACGQKEEAPAEGEETPAEETPAETSDIEVAVVLKTLASEYWGYVKAGLRRRRR